MLFVEEFGEIGNNVFDDNKFSFWKWSAPFIQHPAELRKYAVQLGITNKRIKSIILLSSVHSLSDLVRQAISNQLYDLYGEEKLIDGVEEKLDYNMTFYRSIDSDDPVIIEFTDGDRLEFFYAGESTVRISKNSIPLTLINECQFDPNVLFSGCLGRSISSIEIESKKTCPLYAFHYGDFLKGQTEFIESVILRLDNGEALKFSIYLDFSSIEMGGKNGEKIMIPFDELQTALYDWTGKNNLRQFMFE